MIAEIPKRLVLWKDDYDKRNKQFCVIAPDCKSFFPVCDKRLTIKEDTVEIRYEERDRFLFFPASCRRRPEYKSEYRYSYAASCAETLDALDAKFYSSPEQADRDARAMKLAFERAAEETDEIIVPARFVDEGVSLVYDRIAIPKRPGESEFSFDIEKISVSSGSDGSYTVSLPRGGIKRVYASAPPYSSYMDAAELSRRYEKTFKNTKSDDKGGK